MNRWKSLGVAMVAFGVLSAQAFPDDPVLNARSQRTQGEGDLPPVPRGVTDPPPLPPPETHVKDLRGSKRHGGTKHRTGKQTQAKHSSKHRKPRKKP